MSAADRQENAMSANRHQVWATISGSDEATLAAQVDAVAGYGIRAVEYRLDLIPVELWPIVMRGPQAPVAWWVAHFGTGEQSSLAHDAAGEALGSNADGVIFHSRCDGVEALADACRAAGTAFAAPFHNQAPLTLDAALDEFAWQESLRPSFRKIAVRAHTYDDATALVEATHRASRDGGSPAVGAVFGPHRWARVALPHAGSAITFVVAHGVSNEVAGDDEQLQLSELDDLRRVGGLLTPEFHELRDGSPLATAAGAGAHASG
jgi:hypothetical protein